MRRQPPILRRPEERDGFIRNLLRFIRISDIDQFAEPPGPDRFLDRGNQLWKCRQVENRGGSKLLRFSEPGPDRIDIILVTEFCFRGVDRADPIRKGTLWRDPAAEHRVIEMAVRIDQTWHEDLFAE